MGGRLAENLRQLLDTELALVDVGLPPKVRVVVIPAPLEGRAACQRVGICLHDFGLLPRGHQANQGAAVLERRNVFLLQCQGREGESAGWGQVYHGEALIEFLRGTL